MSKRIFDHIALSVGNIGHSIKWYKDNLDANLLYSDATWAMLDICGTKVALTMLDEHPPHVAFGVNTLSDLGDNYSEHRDGSCYVYKLDPDGNAIELIYWRKNDKDKDK